MLEKLRSYWHRRPAWTPEALAILGGLFYAWQTWGYAHSQRSRLDEGLYMVKGLYFAIGRYWPFQDYGPLTNHMPLSFVIPGYVQAWFGAGVRSGRYFAVLLSVLTLVAVWLAARRLGGRWWAAAAVGAMALNTFIVKTYSIGLSQVLVAVLLAWTLALVVGEKRKTWELLLSAFLAGLLFMTRLNLAPVLPFVVLYIWWHYGWRKAVWGALSGGVVLLALHAVYWPGILRMWSTWVPEGLIPALEPFYPPWRKSYLLDLDRPWWEWVREPDSLEWTELRAFWLAARFNLMAMAGVLTTILLWPRQKDWGEKHRLRFTVVFGALFVILVTVHQWASAGQSCSYFCFSGYMAFFYAIGILVVVASASYWAEQLPWWRQAIVYLFILILTTGVGLGAAADIGQVLAELNILRIFLGSLEGGSIPVWGIFENAWGLTLKQSRTVAPLIFGLGVGLLVIFVSIFIVYLADRRQRQWPSAATTGLIIILLGTFIFMPSEVLSGGEHTHDCGGDVISSYETVGAQLAEHIQPGMQVYWRAGNSTLPLLYIPEAEIYPAQMNDVFAFQNTGGPVDSDDLERYGLWNEEWKQEWLEEADVILVEGRRYNEFENFIEAGRYLQIDTTEPLEECRGDDSRIIILMPNPDFVDNE
ncbi:MAG: hypothetical protein DWQ07_10625 [Chloroflexi bacterium]|nr:MAG: hypothetical protein DWQ07_10625 [Chloroflexota bacterium]MBL1192833.1 hypothetical protein [Chloroflexota bacterium]NOH10126.1 hypothetical protein [Chloroflexota bacterium]